MQICLKYVELGILVLFIARISCFLLLEPSNGCTIPDFLNIGFATWARWANVGFYTLYAFLKLTNVW
jgi:hypothetical protein